MTLLSFLRHLKRVRRNDPTFGQMLYMGDKLRYWEGKARLSPSAPEVEVFVDGSADDDMQQQHKFFADFLESWPNIRESVQAMVHRRLSDFCPVEKVECAWNHLTVSCLSVSKGSIHNAGWKISFVTTVDGGGLFTVQMKGLTPQRVLCDD